MTRDLLNKIAKENKINLDQYDHVSGYEMGKFTFISFANLEVCGGCRRFYNEKTIRKNTMLLDRNVEKTGFWSSDYLTRNEGWQWIYEIR